MKRIVVFGATGNVGVYFIDYLTKTIDTSQFEIVAVGRRKTSFFETYGIRYIRMDITKKEDYDLLPQADVYAIVHLAGLLPAYSNQIDPIAYVDTNIGGGIRILEYARKIEADRILYTQTWAEQAGYWGKEEVLSPFLSRKLIFTGDHALYSITKASTADMMEHYKQEYGIKNFVFRLPNVYLYHPDTEYYVDGRKKVVAYRYMIEKAIKGEAIELWGNPNAFKDILYIKDLCQLIEKALAAEVDGGTYNAGTGIKTTLLEQIEGMIKVFSADGKESEIVMKPEGDGFVSFVMDIENARKDLGYEPRYMYIDYLKDYKEERRKKRFDDLWLHDG